MSSALKHCMVRSLVTTLYSANLHMTSLCTDEMVFYRNLKKIDTDENKAIYSTCIFNCKMIQFYACKSFKHDKCYHHFYSFC